MIGILPHSYLAQHCPSTSWRTQCGGMWLNKSGHSICAQLKSMVSPTLRQWHAAEHLGCSSCGTSSPTLYDLPLLWHLPSLGISGQSTLQTIQIHLFLMLKIMLSRKEEEVVVVGGNIPDGHAPNGTAASSFCDRLTANIQIMIWNLYAFWIIATVTCKISEFKKMRNSEIRE